MPNISVSEQLFKKTVQASQTADGRTMSLRATKRAFRDARYELLVEGPDHPARVFRGGFEMLRRELKKEKFSAAVLLLDSVAEVVSDPSRLAATRLFSEAQLCCLVLLQKRPMTAASMSHISGKDIHSMRDALLTLRKCGIVSRTPGHLLRFPHMDVYSLTQDGHARVAEMSDIPAFIRVRESLQCE